MMIIREPNTGKFYIGGDFTSIGNAKRGGIARLNPDGSLDATFNPGTGFNDNVMAIAWDNAHSKLYVGGIFSSFNGTTVHGIARLNADGSLDTAFNPETFEGFPVMTIAWDASTSKLYAGGIGLYRFNSDGSLDTTLNTGNFMGLVTAIEVEPSGSRLYIGGDFTDYNGTARNRIVRINADGTIDATFNPGSGFEQTVFALALNAEAAKLYVGGSFNTYNGTARKGIARLDSSGALDAGFDPGTGFNSTVKALAFDEENNKIYVGGYFTAFAGVSRNKVARLNSNGALDTGFDPGTGFDDGYVNALTLLNSKLYSVGAFTNYNNAARNKIARLSPDGSLDGTIFNLDTGFNNNVNALAWDAANSMMYVGGAFTYVNGAKKEFIARIKADGSIDNTFNTGTGFTNTVEALAWDAADSKLYVGGSFTYFNGTARSRIARIRSDGTLDTDFNVGTGFNGTVRTLVWDRARSRLIVGGDFTTYKGASANRIAVLDPDGSLDTSFVSGTGFDGSVYSLVIDTTGAKLYVGGNFANYNGSAKSKIARVDFNGTVDAAFSIGTGFNGAVYSLVWDSTNSKLYAGGDFSTFSGTNRSRIARLNTNGSLDAAFNPGTGFDGKVTSLAWDTVNSRLTVGGDFAVFNNISRKKLARLDAFGALDTGFNPGTGFSGTVHTLVWNAANLKLYSAGAFKSYNDASVDNFIRLQVDGSWDTQ